MLENWESFILAFTAILAAAHFIRKVASGAEKDLSKDFKESISIHLLEFIDSEHSKRMVLNFEIITNHIFGNKLLSIHSFIASSYISVFTFTAFYFGVFSENSTILRSANEATSFSNFTKFSIVATAAVFYNVLLDYISLIFTRVILRKKINIYLKIILDCLVNITLIITWLFSVYVVYTFQTDSSIRVNLSNMSIIIYYIVGFINVLLSLPERDITIPVTIFFTSFSTSIWLWFHCLSELSIKLISPMQKIMLIMEIEDRPISALGTIASLLFLIIFTFFLLLRLLFTNLV